MVDGIGKYTIHGQRSGMVSLHPTPGVEVQVSYSMEIWVTNGRLKMMLKHFQLWLFWGGYTSTVKWYVMFNSQKYFYFHFQLWLWYIWLLNFRGVFMYLEPQTTIYKWLFQLDDSQSLHRKWLFPQTSIYKWLFGVIYVDIHLLYDLYFGMWAGKMLVTPRTLTCLLVILRLASWQNQHPNRYIDIPMTHPYQTSRFT